MKVMMCPSVLSRLCCNSGIVSGLSVGVWWSVKISWGMGILEQKDGALVCVSWTLPFSLASSPLSVLNAHFWPYLPHPCSSLAWLNGHCWRPGCLTCGHLCSSTHLIRVPSQVFWDRIKYASWLHLKMCGSRQDGLCMPIYSLSYKW